MPKSTKIRSDVRRVGCLVVAAIRLPVTVVVTASVAERSLSKDEFSWNSVVPPSGQKGKGSSSWIPETRRKQQKARVVHGKC